MKQHSYPDLDSVANHTFYFSMLLLMLPRQIKVGLDSQKSNDSKA
jgi:hypothetical protein